MQKLLLMVAAVGLSAAPAMAQTTPPQAPTNQTATTAPAPQPKTVKKQVCERVEVERSTGSRLSSTTRICKTVEVPVTSKDGQPPADTGSTDRH
ncbi:MAG TPA: hypothetical protein VNS53_10510 [Sphingomicrobium sp.]|jgi:hypothetical protein|nr:hypothetical protein [Sphingomicrobium sp.]